MRLIVEMLIEVSLVKLSPQGFVVAATMWSIEVFWKYDHTPSMHSTSGSSNAVIYLHNRGSIDSEEWPRGCRAWPMMVGTK